MIVSQSYLIEVRARRAAVGDLTVEIVHDPEGRIRLKTVLDGRQFDLCVMRDHLPAADGDVLFVGHACSDIPRLLEVARSHGRLPDEQVREIDERLASVSPGPWTAFIESDGGIGGCDVIRVSDVDDEPDMYLWEGPDFARSELFRFVAAARQDIPRLLSAVRTPSAGSL